MTDKLREAAQQALDALEHHTAIKHPQQRCYRDDAIEALREALAEQEPAQEPVAVHQFRKRGCSDWVDGHPDHTDGGGPYETRTLYTHPPQRKPLTSHKDRPDQNSTFVEGYGYVHTAAVRAIEAAHGIKENI